MLRCHDIELLLAPFVADELEAADAEQVAAHVATCEDCRAELVRECDLRRRLSDLPLQDCPDAIGRAHPQERVSAAIPAAAVRARWTRRTWVLGAAAAAVATVMLVGSLRTTPPDVPGPTPAMDADTVQLAAARRDMIYTLSLANRILDRTGRRTIAEVFTDRLPAAVAGSIRSLTDDPQGG